MTLPGSEEKADGFAFQSVREGEFAAGFGEDEFGDFGEPVAGGSESFKADGVAWSDAVVSGEADEVGFPGEFKVGGEGFLTGAEVDGFNLDPVKTG